MHVAGPKQSRENFLSKIMDTNAANDITFYKLIRSPCNSAGGIGTQLEIDGELITDREQALQAWAKYFGQLSTPSANPKLCQEHAGIISEEVDRIASMEQDNTTPPLVNQRTSILLYQSSTKARQQIPLA